jgi:hypothetical protein
MNIDTGKVYTNEEYEKLRSEFEGQVEELEKQFIEIHPDDLTDREKEKMQVRLSGNTKAAGYARHFRNMRKFVQGKQRS